MRALWLSALGILATSGLAVAQPAAEPPPPPVMRPPPPPADNPVRPAYVPPPPLPPRSLSVTFSPIHLLFPMIEGTLEYKVQPRLGVAGVFGLGSLSVEETGVEQRFFIAEVGASVRYYLTGSFQRGLQVGGEALYAYLKVAEGTTVTVSGAGDGLSIGPFLGYKWTGRGGFTFDGQAGLAYAASRAHASDGTSSASSSENRIYPLLNLNVGWSF